MPHYLSLDGGGSECRALLYDENGPLGYGCAGGTNTNFTSLKACRSNIEQCLDQAFAGCAVPRIDTAYAVLVGPNEVLAEVLSGRTEVGRMVHIEEGRAGLLAGALRKSGIAALSGTGSDAFYYGSGDKTRVVGGLGSILGDQGSGFWIGRKAIRAALAYGEGWGRETILLPMLYEAWGLTDKWEIVQAVYGGDAPFRKVASFVPVVAKAARLGDSVALSCFEEAGARMAEQTLVLARRPDIPRADRVCVCCGGAWKAHPAMVRAFERRMADEYPDLPIRRPLYEPVMAGVVLGLLRRNPLPADDEISEALVPYHDFRIQWQEE
ncbi:MAG: hypothetical protein FWG37_07345 [Clostridia bacterium]|nr:hypothetical protein [Clostridia bacterium]